MDTDDAHSELTEKIIGAAYVVRNEMGRGFLEKAYSLKAGTIGVAAASTTRWKLGESLRSVCIRVECCLPVLPALLVRFDSP